MTKMPDVAKQLKDALDGMPLHMKQVSTMFRKHSLKTGTTRSSIEGTDRAGDLIAKQARKSVDQKRNGDKVTDLPSDYLPDRYIREHQELFKDGVSRFISSSTYRKYGGFQRDDTAFVLPSQEVDRILAQAKGDIRVVEDMLGLPSGTFGNGPLIVIDLPDATPADINMPTGNEAGADKDLWIPGGETAGGVTEGVIDKSSPGAANIEVRRDNDGKIISLTGAGPNLP